MQNLDFNKAIDFFQKITAKHEKKLVYFVKMCHHFQEGTPEYKAYYKFLFEEWDLYTYNVRCLDNLYQLKHQWGSKVFDENHDQKGI